jgi:hypothetical protein
MKKKTEDVYCVRNSNYHLLNIVSLPVPPFLQE